MEEWLKWRNGRKRRRNRTRSEKERDEQTERTPSPGRASTSNGRSINALRLSPLFVHVLFSFFFFQIVFVLFSVSLFIPTPRLHPHCFSFDFLSAYSSSLYTHAAVVAACRSRQPATAQGTRQRTMFPNSRLFMYENGACAHAQRRAHENEGKPGVSACAETSARRRTARAIEISLFYRARSRCPYQRTLSVIKSANRGLG